MAYPGFDLTGKVALITGGNSGIGLGMAEALAQAGAAVAVWGTNPEKNRAAETALTGHGGRVLVQHCDVADEGAVDRAFAETVKTLGHVDACFVVTASLAAISGQARGEHYAASKGGLIAMMKALAVELARHGVRANAILPGWIETPMTEKAFAWNTFVEKVLPRVPMRRWGVPADFGAIAVYLASDASSYHSGDTFIIDGAYSIF